VKKLSVLAFLVLLSIPLWHSASGDDPSSTADPHTFMTDQSKCDQCHDVVWQDSKGDLEENVFVVSFIDYCNTCHKVKNGRSHPVGMTPYRLVPKEKYPEKLPLQQMEEDGEGVITCMTCHYMHGARFSERKLFPRQNPFPGKSSSFLTYYLRVLPVLPREGFAPLCQTCHPKL